MPETYDYQDLNTSLDISVSSLIIQGLPTATALPPAASYGCLATKNFHAIIHLNVGMEVSIFYFQFFHSGSEASG